ncbi:MAG: 23S rRNA (uracil(1939)-C(5))-methyltransferase RlmD [Bacteroidales bacterium]|nr:23S rRNA (uracil(1939)-C(5))-methyltransferase RlmD [Bacteroidales bacterium]
MLLTDLEIIDAASDGNAVAKKDDLVFFIPFGAPGDVVDAETVKKKKSFRIAKIVNIKKPSPHRIQPFCKYFGLCGGCKWQHLDYQSQLFYKQKQVVDALTRIGKVNVNNINDIISSDKTTYYRNKLEYTFSNFKWMSDGEFKSKEERNLNGIGFHLPNMYDRIIDIEECFFQPEPSNQIRNSFRDYAISHNLTFYNVKKHEGLLRNLIIRCSNTGGLMVVLVVNENDTDSFFPLLDFIRDSFPQITSLMYVVNRKFNDDIGDQNVIPYYGEDHLIEEMENIRFYVGPKSFYQTNHDQAYKLYKVAREFADLQGDEIVYDLYTGAGTIANFVASKAKKVVGIEYVEQAIENAIYNSSINNITNTSFFAGDMAKVLTDDFINANGRPDVIITDPPRAGMHDKVIAQILKCSPKKIVYVSCNPATQARDISLLSEKYSIGRIQPVDMFPHTQHVENVVELILQ